MEQLIDTVSTVRPDNTAILALCVLFDHIAVLAEQSTRLDNLDGFVQALS